MIGDLDTHDGTCRTPRQADRRHRRSRSTTGWRPSTSSRRRSTTATRRRAGRPRTRPASAAIRAGSRSAATAPAATWPRASRSARATRAGRASCYQLLVYPVTDARFDTGVVSRQRRGLLPQPRRHGVVLEPLPRQAGGRRQSRTRHRCARPTCAGCRRRRSSPPSTTRCATRARRTASSSRRPACRSTCKRYDGVIHGFFQLGDVVDRSSELMDDSAAALGPRWPTGSYWRRFAALG